MSGITVQLDTMPAPVMAACLKRSEVSSMIRTIKRSSRHGTRRNTADCRKKLHTAGRQRRKERKQ